MKKKIAVTLAVIVILSGLFIITNLMNNTKVASLKVSENKIEFYPSQRHMIVLSSRSNIDEHQLQFKSKDINVQKVECIISVDGRDSQCALSFSGFKPTSEKVEIKYGDKSYYVSVKVKSLNNPKKNMSSDEQYEIALAKLLTKYHVIVPDDIKNEKLRLKVEDQIEKLKDKY